jgi:pimeloyl-ACP methyl ester carboxylesterase
MSSPFRRPAALGRAVTLLAAAAVLALAGRASAQAAKPEDVSFPTADGVELKGTYYPSSKGKNGPVAILLHKYGSDRTKGDWDKLAKKLQASDKGFAVLTFDFRGHGASTSVNADFWQKPYNVASYIKGASPKKMAISYKDFSPNYFPYLVNDIAAARRYIDQRNDAQDCNAANIFIIGAQESAALGFLWMAHEWQRVASPGAQARKGGQDIAGAIWLTAQVKGPHNHTMPYTSMTNRSPDLRDKTPMSFFYGDQDRNGANDANHFFTTVLKANQTVGGVKPSLDFKVAVKGTSLTGIELYKSPKTDELITENIDKVMGQRGGGAVWANRKVDEMRFEPVPLGYFGIQ